MNKILAVLLVGLFAGGAMAAPGHSDHRCGHGMVKAHGNCMTPGQLRHEQAMRAAEVRRQQHARAAEARRREAIRQAQRRHAAEVAAAQHRREVLAQNRR